MSKDLKSVCAGFIPLMDASLLIAAKEKGFAEEEGLDLTLMRETSWATIRDRIAVGHFDVAHMLAPMPVASALGLMPLPVQILAPMALGLGGNAVTISKQVAAALKEKPLANLDAKETGKLLAQHIEHRNERGDEKLVFGVVHPYSGHNYELRYWLAASGIDPDQDVEIVVMPPPLMPDALASGILDGYCVGEPWNSVATEEGTGEIITTKSKIWRSSPEKVLGASEKFALEHPETLSALIRALYNAAQWCDDTANIPELAKILSKDSYIGVDAGTIEKSLKGQIIGCDEAEGQDFFIPFQRAATFPWHSHALWFYSQMVRWGHVSWSEDHLERLKCCYRPDLYRAALSELNVPIPSANAKVEGALQETSFVGTMSGELALGPDGFFDGQIFDPDDLAQYIRSQA